mmetsp:Transcript_99496/g.276885  ORF Transcript_99496/g.276885 Transcript_99496/m.276885 type:complete len:288 (+) Transcript_99496:127-990(+)
MGGSACTCNCTRTTPEGHAEDDTTPSAHAPVSPGGGALEEVKVAFKNGTIVPVVARFQVLQQGRGGHDQQKSTPRFDEAPRSARSERGGRTPRDTPRDLIQMAASETGVADTSELSYEGTYLGGKKHGCGILRMKACTYTGDFWHDVKHGRATLKWDDGRQYCGQFKNGRFHGSAVMTWPDGRKYDGQYAENQKHGQGTFTWQDGRCYEGQWVAGKRHGIGTYTNAKGVTRRGVWQMDRPLQWDEEPPDAEEADGAGGAGTSAATGDTTAVLQAPLDDDPDVKMTNL